MPNTIRKFVTEEEREEFLSICCKNGALAVTIIENGPSPWTPFGMNATVYDKILADWNARP